MKNNKRTRSRNISPNQSNRKKTQPSSVRGLITSRQQSIKTTSEVSQYTQRTNRTNTFVNSQDFDFVDDQIEKEEIKDVFVSQQQQKVIQKILEVARKGKINQKNAFQIPLKVLDNDNVSIGKAKFWKFASELLGASMSIYEKRIQNTWINTNLIHDKLARMTVKGNNNNNNDQQQNDEQNNKKQLASDYLMLPIQQFRDPKILDNIKIGQQTLESVQKINISKLKQHFTEDPLFQRKIKAFDNTSLKGLLLNVFDIGLNCEIQLYCNQRKLVVRQNSQIIKNQCILPSQSQYMQQNIEKSKKVISESNLFNSITEFKKKNTFTSHKQQGIIDSIGFTPRQENNDKQNPIFEELQEFLHHHVQNLDSQMPVYDDFAPNTNSNDLKFFNQEQKTINSDFPQLSQQNFSQMSQNSPMMFHSDGPFSYTDADKSFHSVMTPWEMQFKEGKLRKKSIKRRQKKQGKKKQKIQPGIVQFDALKVQNKKLTLKTSKKQNNVTSKSKKKNNPTQNLVPPQLAVYEKINYKKVVQVHRRENKFNNQLHEDLPDFLAPDPSMLQINQNQLKKQYSPNKNEINMNEQNIVNMQQDVLMFSNQRGQKPQRKYNIRQTKKILYEKVKDQRQIRISQIDLPGLKPASIIITFLHIANEKNLIVRNTKEEDDVILAWE